MGVSGEGVNPEADAVLGASVVWFLAAPLDGICVAVGVHVHVGAGVSYYAGIDIELEGGTVRYMVRLKSLIQRRRMSRRMHAMIVQRLWRKNRSRLICSSTTQIRRRTRFCKNCSHSWLTRS